MTLTDNCFPAAQTTHLPDLARKGAPSTRVTKRQKTYSSENAPESAKVDAVRTAFEATSQRTRWTYSEEELQRTRRNLNEGAVQQCRHNWDIENVSTDVVKPNEAR